MKFTIPEKNYNLIEFYNVVAREMGYTETSELHYDCRNINIAANIQDGFYTYYRETNPGIPASEVNLQVTLLLACSGPKVDEALKANEVEVFDGFIC